MAYKVSSHSTGLVVFDGRYWLDLLYCLHFAMRSGYVDFFCSVSAFDRTAWGRREHVGTGLGLEVGIGLGGMKSGGQIGCVLQLQPGVWGYILLGAGILCGMG